MVQIGNKAFAHTLIALLASSLIGCGSSGSTIASSNSAGPSGRSIQGPVSGATIWGDDLTSGSRFTLDSPEQSTQTTTGSGGAYTLKTTPSYKYVIVSQGGTDTLTGRTATTMIAPGGAKAVSPLTTLVMLDTSGNLASTLNALLPGGASFDSDFTATGGLTPSAMVFITSITTAITSFDVAIQNAATANGATLTAQQWNNINLTVYSQLATQFSKLSSTTLSNTAGLATNLQTALNAAITTITANNPNITGLVSNTVAATIANNAVATAANIVGNATGNAALAGVTPSNVQTGNGFPVSTTGTVTESQIVNQDNLKLVIASITNTANTVSSGITVTSTPSNYSPPPITVINNPSVAGYQLIISSSGSSYIVKTFTITFSDDMVATSSGGTNYNHSVLNPANYQFSQSGCAPSSYASKVVTFTCGNLNPGTFTVTIPKSTASSGVWASSTSLGLIVDTTKPFTLPVITGGTGGSTYNLF